MLYKDALKIAFEDIKKGWERRHLWLLLAWDDIRLRYKRSVLGPMWITLGTGFFIVVLSALWTELMAKKASIFVPWFSIGIITWQFISSIVTESSTILLGVSGIIQNIAMPLSIHIYRSVMRHLLNYVHNFIIVIIVLIIFPPPLTAKIILFFPGILIIAVTAFATSIIFGILGARFRDFSYTVSMLMGPIFFITPIIWMPDMLSGTRSVMAQLNPFAHFLAIVREPLLGHAPTLINYIVTMSISGILVLISLLFLGKHKSKVAYWV